MKKSLILLPLLALALAASCGQQTAPASKIELGLQAYTFRNLTLAEALDCAVAMKIKNIQLYPKQRISPTSGEVSSHNMNDATKAEMRALFTARGLKPTSYGVIQGTDEADWRKIFAFAKEMGLHDIAIEPKTEEFLPLIAKLSAETGVLVTLHNHARPPYGNPDAALDVINRFGKNFGFCADTGHWARAGHDPVATLQKFATHITSVHFKDLSERGVVAAHDMPWGTGASAAALQVLELRRQGFEGIAYMEYEHKLPQEQLFTQALASAQWFQAALAASDDDLLAGRVVPPGYASEKNASRTWAGKRDSSPARYPAPNPLFAPDLSNADMRPGSWEYKDGVLSAKGGGDIWTKESYGDFALNLDFRCEEKTNSGVFLRCGDLADWINNTIEVQILQGDAPNDKHLVGALFDVAAPKRQIEIEPGRWYHFTIIAQGQKITVSIDGERVLDADLSKWKEPGKNPDGTSNKFKHAYADMPKTGRIGLQYHGNPVSFRNMVVETIP